MCGGDATGPRRAFLPLDLIVQEKVGAEPCLVSVSVHSGTCAVLARMIIVQQGLCCLQGLICQEEAWN